LPSLMPTSGFVSSCLSPAFQQLEALRHAMPFKVFPSPPAAPYLRPSSACTVSGFTVGRSPLVVGPLPPPLRLATLRDCASATSGCCSGGESVAPLAEARMPVTPLGLFIYMVEKLSGAWSVASEEVPVCCRAGNAFRARVHPTSRRPQPASSSTAGALTP
jgi:hypothetical protein